MSARCHGVKRTFLSLFVLLSQHILHTKFGQDWLSYENAETVQKVKDQQKQFVHDDGQKRMAASHIKMINSIDCAQLFINN